MAFVSTWLARRSITNATTTLDAKLEVDRTELKRLELKQFMDEQRDVFRKQHGLATTTTTKKYNPRDSITKQRLQRSIEQTEDLKHQARSAQDLLDLKPILSQMSSVSQMFNTDSTRGRELTSILDKSTINMKQMQKLKSGVDERLTTSLEQLRTPQEQEQYKDADKWNDTNEHNEFKDEFTRSLHQAEMTLQR